MPDISIIIPTLNESKNLPLILADLSVIDEISEIIIIDSKSNDETKDISKIYGARFYKINKQNRGLQLNYGAKKAKGNWLLFIHADSRLKDNWATEIKSICNKNNNYIYFFKFKVNSIKIIFRLLEVLVNLRSCLLKSPYGDQGLLIHKNTFFIHKGFKEIPLMEDIDFINRINMKEFLLPLKSSIFTSSRKWDKVNIFERSYKNWSLRRRWLRGDPLESIYADYYRK